jgi:hypothetical protein
VLYLGIHYVPSQELSANIQTVAEIGLRNNRINGIRGAWQTQKHNLLI